MRNLIYKIKRWWNITFRFDLKYSDNYGYALYNKKEKKLFVFVTTPEWGFEDYEDIKAEEKYEQHIGDKSW